MLCSPARSVSQRPIVPDNRLKPVMRARSAGLLASCFLLSVSAALTAVSDLSDQSHPSSSTTAPPLVYAAEVDSIIHPVSAEYMIETMDRADRSGAALVVFTLRTPGGLIDSTREIVSHMVAAKTPVAVFVAPL